MKRYFVLIILSLFLFLSRVDALTIAPVDVTTMDISKLLDAMDKGYLTSERLVKIYLERIEEYDDMFNSINQLNEHALEQAKELDKERQAGNIKGKLHGIPILVKCNIDVYGMPTTAGTKALKDNYPKENATVVQKLIDEGAIILGSTNMSELAFSAATSYSSYGYVRNVFNVDFTPYGSSGGAAVSVKAGFAAASLGTDTNSSVRLPASGAGLVGIRPTYGLVSRNGVIPYDYERDTVGVISQNVSDSALLLSIIYGTDSKDKVTEGAKDVNLSLKETSLKGVNIGVPLQYVKGSSKSSGVLGETDPEIYELLEKSINVLKEQGANIIYLDDFVKSSNLTIATSTYAGSTMCDYFNEYIKGTDGTIRSFQELAESKGHVQRLSGYAKSCGKTSNSSTAKRDTKKSVYRDYVDEYFEEYELDLILYPTLKNKVFKYNGSGNISPGSSLGSVIGYPSITIPMGKDSNGFSYGIEFFTRAYEEEIIYNVAYEFEKNNGNKVDVSPLTPSLYSVPEEVQKLKSLYEEALKDNKHNEEWISNVRSFFMDYDKLDDITEVASNLVDSYSKKASIISRIARGSKSFSNKKVIEIVVIVINLLACLVIIKNVSKCFM